MITKYPIILDKYERELVARFWTLIINRGLFKLHFTFEKIIGKKKYSYYDDDISAESICRKHKIKVT